MGKSESLRKMAERAWSRPVSPEEMTVYEAFYRREFRTDPAKEPEHFLDYVQDIARVHYDIEQKTIGTIGRGGKRGKYTTCLKRRLAIVLHIMGYEWYQEPSGKMVPAPYLDWDSITESWNASSKPGNRKNKETLKRTYYRARWEFVPNIALNGMAYVMCLAEEKGVAAPAEQFHHFVQSPEYQAAVNKEKSRMTAEFVTVLLRSHRQ